MARRFYLTLFLPLTALFVLAGVARADVAPLFFGNAAPLVQMGDERPGQMRAGSLFAGTTEGTFFAALPARIDARPNSTSEPVAQLLTLIAQAEAGRDGYDAVQHGARIRPNRPPTQMTLGDIYAWIDATPGQPHAIGRYQFIPPTLRRVARIRGFGPDVRFSPEVQDALALVLLEEAGLRQFERNEMPRAAFMRNLARIWAGLPLPNGRSYYEGYAGNRAAMTWVTFRDGINRIWPAG